jgi:hypothetical protein
MRRKTRSGDAAIPVIVTSYAKENEANVYSFRVLIAGIAASPVVVE